MIWISQAAEITKLYNAWEVLSMVADSQYALASFCKFTFLQVSSFAYALLHHWADYGLRGRNLIGTYAGAKDVMMNKNFQGTHPLVWGTKTQNQVSCCFRWNDN